MDLSPLLSSYDLKNLAIGVLGGHSALDVCYGAKKHGFRTVAIVQKERATVYDTYYKTRADGRGCVDSVIPVDSFQDVLHSSIQDQLKSQNTIFIHNRYFWVYFSDFQHVENSFALPLFGSRHLLRLEERDQPYNQYDLLRDAGIRTPKIFQSYKDIDRPVMVKAHEVQRTYERAFFVVDSSIHYQQEGSRLESEGRIAPDWRKATIEEFVVGAPVNFNFFYSPLTGELELLGTDTRRQTNLDGFLRMTADQQIRALKHVPLKMIETGHIACTVKESLLAKAFSLGEAFVAATQTIAKKIDPAQKGIIGPFALQGSVVAEDGKEDIVIFDVSLRIPGSPGTSATPYTSYLYGHPMSVGERVALEIKNARDAGTLEKVLT